MKALKKSQLIMLSLKDVAKLQGLGRVVEYRMEKSKIITIESRGNTICKKCDSAKRMKERKSTAYYNK